MDADQISRSKENIQPLRQGRVTSQLSEALQAHASVNNEIQQAFQKKIHDFELSLHTYEGDDPLFPWVEYIAWVEQYFPKKGKEGNFPTLLKKCLDLFKDSDMYKQDQRYVKLWIKYLEMQPDKTSEMYEMVLQHGIGTKVAHFYHSWAMEQAELKDMKRADQVYRMGISAGAEPADQLQQAHKNFQSLVMRQSIDSGAFNSNTEQDFRPTLGHLHASGDRNLVPHVRTLASQPLQPLNHYSVQTSHPLPAAQAKFNFFKDENGPYDESGMLPTKQSLKSFPSRDAMQSENMVEPSKWTDCASHLPAASAVFSTPFKVHADQVPATPNSSARKMLPGSVLKVKKATEQPEWTVPLAIFEPHDPKHKPMYCKDKVYTGGIEFSLEELRAQHYYKMHHTQPRSSAGLGAEVMTRSATVGKPVTNPLELKQDVREPLLPDQSLQVPEICLREPEVSMEEHLSKSYLRLRKAWEEKKAKQALATASSAALCNPQPAPSLKELTYEVPANSKLCVTYATFENGIEKSLEELRASKYPQLTSHPEVITHKPNIAQPSVDSKIQYMFEMNKYSSEAGELSFEERRAMHYVLKMQEHQFKIRSGASTPSASSSQATTPQGTPVSALDHLSVLCQSMTVNTKEAMAAMNGLWCSLNESRLSVPSPKAMPFSIFQDHTQSVRNAQFQIFSDHRTSNAMTENINTQKSKGPKRGLQMLDSEARAWPLHAQGQAGSTNPIFSRGEEPLAQAFASTSTQGGFAVYQENAFSSIPPHVKCDEEEEMEHESALPVAVYRGFDIVNPAVESSSFVHVPQKDIFSNLTQFNNPIQENLQTGFNFTKDSRHVIENDLFVRKTLMEQKREEPMEIGVEVNTNRQTSSIFQEFTASQILPVGIAFPQNYEIPYVPSPPDDDKVEEECPNKENVAPNNYQIPTELRELSGILTEATNVHFIPLEDQERMLEEEDRREQLEEDQTDLDIQPTSKFVEDVTSMTTAFRPTNFMSSTPYHLPTQSLFERVSQTCDDAFNNPASSAVQVKEEIKEEEEQEYDEVDCLELRKRFVASNWEPEDNTVQRCQVLLSPILEVTGESRGSRSGSSGSSGGSRLYATTASSLHGFSKTPGQFSKTPGQFSKTPGQFSKTPGQFSCVSDSHVAMSMERPIKPNLLDLDEEYEDVKEIADDVMMPPPFSVPTVEIKQEPQEAVVKVEPDVSETETHFASLSLAEVDDPFCSKLQRKLLSSIKVALDSRTGFEQFPLPLPSLKINNNIYLGNKIAKIKKSIGEGAYAKVYLALMGHEEKPSVLKVATDDINCWDFYISSEIQRRLPDPILSCKFNTIKGNHLFNNGVIYEMDYVSAATLLDVTNLKPSISLNLMAYLVLQVLEIVYVLHQIQIIHADIKPDNFLVIPSHDERIATLQLIDFGRCVDMSLFPKGTSFSSVFKSADFRCLEMRTNRSWTYQLDLFATANTIHCILFNKYMNMQEIRGRFMPTIKARRYWDFAELYDKLFETLLNVKSCDDLPDLMPFITSLRDRVNTSDAIARELAEIFK